MIARDQNWTTEQYHSAIVAEQNSAGLGEQATGLPLPKPTETEEEEGTGDAEP